MKYITTLMGIIISVYFLSGCSPSPAKASDEETARKSVGEKQEIDVMSIFAGSGVFSKELTSNGTLLTKEKAIVTFKVNEQIKTLQVQEGQQIKAGRIIASIDDFAFKKHFKDAQNSYNKALIDIEDLLLGYGHALKDTASISKNVLKMCRIRSGYNTALSNLQEAERNLSHTIITAPISGVVSNLQAKENNHSSQYKYCCQIIDSSSMEVEFHVLEGELGMVGKGQRVKVLPFALPEVSKTGTIT